MREKMKGMIKFTPDTQSGMAISLRIGISTCRNTESIVKVW